MWSCVPTTTCRSLLRLFASLHEQDETFELICLDNQSEDGTVEELQKYTDRIVNIPKGSYIPGRALNLGMELTQGEFVVFLNSDCTPQNKSWLGKLLAGFNGSTGVAAVFGRQIPRPDCYPIFVKDTEDTYGDGSRQKYWKHCFSMASSAISRSVWESMRFSEKLRYFGRHRLDMESTAKRLRNQICGGFRGNAFSQLFS